MPSLHRLIGACYRKTDALLRPVLFRREKSLVLRRYPALKPVMEAFEARYVRVEYGAHDLSLMERIQRKMTDKDEFVYGTTPWHTFLKIADALNVQPDDVFIEPGCGTGHLCFLMNQIYGIEAIGIETIANFIQTAKALQKELAEAPHHLPSDKLRFYNLDFFTSDFSRGTIFYVAGTCFPDDYRERLYQKIAREAPEGARLITLTHAIEHPAFRLHDQVAGVFSWGRDKALIYTKHRKA